MPFMKLTNEEVAAFMDATDNDFIKDKDMNRVGDAEFLLEDRAYERHRNQDQNSPLKRGFLFGFGAVIGLWLGIMIAGSLTIALMLWTGIALQ